MALLNSRRVSVSMTQDGVQVANAKPSFAAQILAFWYEAFAAKPEPEKPKLGFQPAPKEDKPSE